jgi:nitroreductase
MDVYEAIRTRKSIRAWAERDVEEAALRRVLEAGRLAPSAKNLQEWRFVVVRDPATRAELTEAAKGQRFVGEAPVVLAFVSESQNDYRMTCGQLRYPIDAAILQDHVSLLATAEGLATCWVGAFHADQAKAALGLPDEAEVVELMPLGHPADTPPAKERLGIEELVHWEKW